LLNRQLDLKFFQKQIGSDIVKSIRKITFCGNDGDPIYCRDLVEIIRWLKSVNQNINLTLIEENKYSGICLIGNKGVFLNSQGEFYPCCWTANRYDHNKIWIERAKNRFNLKSRTFLEIINDDFWSQDFLQFDSHECNKRCSKQLLVNKEHTMLW
jgi:hypothetical protein